jgi:hypothetical protein
MPLADCLSTDGPSNPLEVNVEVVEQRDKRAGPADGDGVEGILQLAPGTSFSRFVLEAL